MKQLSWADFDGCVKAFTQRYGSRAFSGVYGIPRGGLCLAVALSHALELPLQEEPDNNSFIVDDVFETGRTLQGFRGRWPQATYAVWVSKVPLQWWDAADVNLSAEWLVFPWENTSAASVDEQMYRQSRFGL